MTPSARSPLPAGEPTGFASDSDGVHTCAYDEDSDKVVYVLVTRTSCSDNSFSWLRWEDSRCLLREVTCLTWRPRFACRCQLLPWLRKACEPTRLCSLVDVSKFTFPIRWWLGEGCRVRCHQRFVQVGDFGWYRNTLHVIWRRTHGASKNLVLQISSCSRSAIGAISCTCCSCSLFSYNIGEDDCMCMFKCIYGVGARTHDWESLTCLLSLSSPRQPGVAGSSPFTLTTSLAIPVVSSFSSNGPTTTPLTSRGFCPVGSVVWVSLKFVRPHWWGSEVILRFLGYGPKVYKILHLPRMSKATLSYFLSWVAKTQLNHWTKRVVSTQLITWDLRLIYDCFYYLKQ